MELFVSVAGMPVRVRADDAVQARAIHAYLQPAIIDRPKTISGDITVTPSGVRVDEGPRLRTNSALSPLLHFEWLLVGWCTEFSGSGLALHCGGVIFEQSPVLLVAESGGGKSTMTLEAVRVGASYLSDDLLLLDSPIARGLARAIRFKDMPADRAGSHTYLEKMDTRSFQTTIDGSKRVVPLWWDGGEVKNEADLRQLNPSVVVRLARGPASIRSLSALERVVTLHEAAIASRGEYDGCLGSGPAYELSWDTDPGASFQLLVDRLREG